MKKRWKALASVAVAAALVFTPLGASAGGNLIPVTPDLTIDCATQTWEGVPVEGVNYSEYTTNEDFTVAVATTDTGYQLAIPEGNWFFYDAHANSAVARIVWADDCPEGGEQEEQEEQDGTDPITTLPETGTNGGLRLAVGAGAVTLFGVSMLLFSIYRRRIRG